MPQKAAAVITAKGSVMPKKGRGSNYSQGQCDAKKGRSNVNGKGCSLGRDYELDERISDRVSAVDDPYESGGC